MKLLFAEDTADLNRTITMVLEHEGYDVDSALDGEQAWEFLQENSYDGVILDIMMPKKTGMEVLTEMRSHHILAPVLLLTAKTEIDDRVAGLDAGADDYLAKPFAMKELLARVRSMIRRHEDYEEKQIQYKDIYLNGENFSLTAGNSIRLSTKEFELMKVLITNSEVELSTKYILEHVWNGEEDADEETVWLYISYLKGKIRAVGSVVDIQGKKGGSFQLITG
ncbi:MAG: response regulator transcription factor [Eubacterium sp.]|nr:response regulator transcription factor [Eubacterium sp.]